MYILYTYLFFNVLRNDNDDIGKHLQRRSVLHTATPLLEQVEEVDSVLACNLKDFFWFVKILQRGEKDKKLPTVL